MYVKLFKLLSSLSCYIIGGGTIVFISLVATNCGGNVEKTTDYTAVAQYDETSKVWYVGDDIVGQTSGRWKLNLTADTKGCEIKHFSDYPFVGHDVYVPKWVEIDNTKYDVLLFQGGGILSGKIVLPDSLLTIGTDAFGGINSSNLTSIIVSDGVTTIMNDAFYNCDGLISITLPNSILSIGENAFGLCISLTSFTFPSELVTIGAGCFSECNGLQSIIIPDTIRNIGNGAFANCINLTSATLPENIDNFDTGIFYGCKSLSSVILPQNITEIPDSTFYGCSNLQSITLPPQLEQINVEAFYECSNLTSIIIPASVLNIANASFEKCIALQSVTILGDTIQIDKDAFINDLSFTDLTLYGRFKEYNTNYLDNTKFTTEDRTGAYIHVPSNVISTYIGNAKWIEAIGEQYINNVFVALQ